MSLLSLLTNLVPNSDDENDDFLTNPGDEASIRVTDSGRRVGKAKSGDGSWSYSKTEYPTTGTVVETRTTKRK